MTTDLLTFSITDLKPYVNQVLNIRFSDELTLAAELATLTPLPKYKGFEREPFSFVLRTDQKTHYCHQGTYILEHPEKGDIPIFLVPIGPDEKGMNYESIFS